MKKISIFYFIFIFTLVVSCIRKTEIIREAIPNPPKLWTKHKDIDGYYQTLYNAKADTVNNRLYVRGKQHLMTIDLMNNSTTSQYSFCDPDTRMALNENIVFMFSVYNIPETSIYALKKDRQFEYIRNNFNDTNIFSSFPSFSSNAFLARQNTFGAINNDNQILVPFYSNLNDSKQYFKLLNIKLDDTAPFSSYNSSYLSVLSSRYIGIDRSPSQFYDVNVTTFFNKFFILMSETGNFIMYPNGTYRQVIVNNNQLLYKIFQVNNNLYAISQDYISISTDQGESWTSLYNINSTGLINYNYRCINGEIIIFFGDRIYHLKKEGTDLVTKELKTEDLDKNWITDIVTFNKKVYVLTLGGLFYRDLSTFFDYKY